jgi:hypothetical protein
MPISRKDFGAYLSLIPDYLWDVCRYWYVVAIGGGIAVLGALGDMGLEIPNWVWWAVGLGSIAIAQFLAWNAVRKERDQLRRYDIAQGTLTRLSEFRGALVGMQNEQITTEAEFGGWRQRYSDLRVEIMDFIRDNVSPAEANLFETLGDYEPVGIAGKPYVSMNHFDITARVIRDRRWLDKAVQDYGRQRFRPELSATAAE